MTTEFDLSIIIPTHNRATCLYHTIQACLSLGPRCEIVVCDSSETPSSLQSLGVLGRHNVQLRVNPSTYSVVDNFNSGVKMARGRYMLFIGDDDFVSSGVLTAVNYASVYNADCISFTYPATYWWPTFNHRRTGKLLASRLQVNEYTSNFTRRNAKRELKRAAERLGQGPLRMPKAYCGLLRRSYVLSVIQEFGPLFGGVSPDIYSAVLLSMHSPVYFEYDFPVVVPGISASSTSGLSSEGRHVGRLFASAHLIPFRGIKWDRRVPKFYSVQSVWAYSMLSALNKTKSNTRPYFLALYLETIIFNREFLRNIMISAHYWIKYNPLEAIRQSAPSIARFLSSVLTRWYERQKRDKNQVVFFVVGLSDTAAAKIALEKWLLEKS